MKTAFLDRDGTINRDYPDVEWKGKTEPELIDGAMEGLRFLQDQGYALIMITNQYLIDEGIITYADYQNFTEEWNEEPKQDSSEIHIGKRRIHRTQRTDPQADQSDDHDQGQPSVDVVKIPEDGSPVKRKWESMSFQTTGCSPTGNVRFIHILEKGNAIVLITADAPDQDRQYRTGNENDPAFWLLMKQLFCKQKEEKQY